MNDAIIEATASAFAELDLSAENARIVEIEAGIAQLEAAEKSARERCTAISREIAEFRGPSGAAVADALLANHAPSEAAVLGPDLDALEREKAALVAGAQALAHRAQVARAELQEVKAEAKLKLRPITQPLVDELTEEATALGERALEIFASLSAIAGTTGNGWQQARAVGLMVTGAVDDFGLLLRLRGSVEAPADIVTALRALDGKGAALPVSIRTHFST
jgi:hypothetical protein